MSKLIYRVISATGALGSGFSIEVFNRALEGRVDVIIANAGSTATGPAHLAAGTSEFGRDAIASELQQILSAGLRLDCPVVIGNCGTAGGRRNLDGTIDIAKAVLGELAPVAMKVATIDSEIDSEAAIKEFRKGTLLATGLLPELSVEILRNSTIVAQMGVHPIIEALQSGAKLVLTGRCASAALYAADMIRCGIDAGLAYHAGHILKSGTLACEGGSESGCLVGEVYDDGTVSFVAFAPDTHPTAYSIASHALYREGHPQLQFYPEGVLALSDTEFLGVKTGRAGFRGSVFHRSGTARPWSIKLEGAVQMDDGCCWSVCHLLLNDDMIKSELFPISCFEVSGHTWEHVATNRAHYFDLVDSSGIGSFDARTLSLIADVSPGSPATGSTSLGLMGVAIRGAAAGINRLTFDILFSSSEAYEHALVSNVFHKASLSVLLGFPEHSIVGSFFVDSCHAIKITINRSELATSEDDRLKSTAQYCAVLEKLRIPIHASASVEAPA